MKSLMAYLWPTVGVLLAAVMVWSVFSILGDYSKFEEIEERLRVAGAKIEAAELEAVQSGSRIKMRPVDEKEFIQLVITRFYHMADAVGSMDIKNLSKQSGKAANQNMNFEGDNLRVLEYIYKLRESVPGSRPTKIQYRRSPKGASVSASFETKGKEWPQKPVVPTVPPEVKKQISVVTEIFRDPSVAKVEGPISTGPVRAAQKWELIGLTRSEVKAEAMVQQVAGSSATEDLEFKILKQNDRLMDWNIDLTPFEKGLMNNGQSYILLKRGKDELKWSTGGDIFDGKTVIPKK